MANFYVHVQPSGTSGEYLVNLFFTDMQSAFNSAYYESVGLCTEPFSNGAAAISGNIWEQQASPMESNNWYYRQINAGDHLFYSGNSYTLYAFAKDADNGQYWNFNAGQPTTIYIRTPRVSVDIRKDKDDVKYAHISIDDLCVPWNHINYNLIGFYPINLDDNSYAQIDQGHLETVPDATKPSYNGYSASKDVYFVDNDVYTLIPYARLPNETYWHLMLPNYSFTVDMRLPPIDDDGHGNDYLPQQLKFEPHNHTLDDTDHVMLSMYVQNRSIPLQLKVLNWNTMDEFYIETYPEETQGLDGDRNSTVTVYGLAPSMTYYIEIRSVVNGVLSANSVGVWAMTLPKINYADAEMLLDGQTKKIFIHANGSLFDDVKAVVRTGSSDTSQYVDIAEFDDLDMHTDVEFTQGLYSTIDYGRIGGYYVFISTFCSASYSDYGIWNDIDYYNGYSGRFSKPYRIHVSYPGRPSRFKWQVCKDSDGHKRTDLPAVMTKAEWDMLQQITRDMIDYRGGGAQYNMGTANIDDPVSADLYNNVKIAIQGAGNGTSYGRYIPTISQGDRMYASHFNTLMDELNAASGYTVNNS